MYLLGALAVAVFIVTSGFLLLKVRRLLIPTPLQEIPYSDLSAGERKIVSLIGEVYGDAITSRVFTREAGVAKLGLTFDSGKSKVKELEVNLSSLARKQNVDGLTDASVKESLKF